MSHQTGWNEAGNLWSETETNIEKARNQITSMSEKPNQPTWYAHIACMFSPN